MRTSTTPRGVASAPTSDGKVIITMPTKPTPMPKAWEKPGILPMSRLAMTRVRTGVPAVIMPATAESRVVSAWAKSHAGPAFPSMAIAAILAQSWRSIATRALGNTARAPAPSATRPKATTLGAR